MQQDLKKTQKSILNKLVHQINTLKDNIKVYIPNRDENENEYEDDSDSDSDSDSVKGDMIGGYDSDINYIFSSKKSNKNYRKKRNFTKKSKKKIKKCKNIEVK